MITFPTDKRLDDESFAPLGAEGPSTALLAAETERLRIRTAREALGAP